MFRHSGTVIQAAAIFQQAAQEAIQAHPGIATDQPHNCSIEHGEHGTMYLRAANLSSTQELRSTLDWLHARQPASRLQMRCRRSSDGRYSLRAALYPLAACQS